MASGLQCNPGVTLTALAVMFGLVYGGGRAVRQHHAGIVQAAHGAAAALLVLAALGLMAAVMRWAWQLPVPEPVPEPAVTPGAWPEPAVASARLVPRPVEKADVVVPPASAGKVNQQALTLAASLPPEVFVTDGKPGDVLDAMIAADPLLSELDGSEPVP